MSGCCLRHRVVVPRLHAGDVRRGCRQIRCLPLVRVLPRGLRVRQILLEGRPRGCSPEPGVPPAPTGARPRRRVRVGDALPVLLVRCLDVGQCLFERAPGHAGLCEHGAEVRLALGETLGGGSGLYRSLLPGAIEGCGGLAQLLLECFRAAAASATASSYRACTPARRPAAAASSDACRWPSFCRATSALTTLCCSAERVRASWARRSSRLRLTLCRGGQFGGGVLLGASWCAASTPASVCSRALRAATASASVAPSSCEPSCGAGGLRGSLLSRIVERGRRGRQLLLEGIARSAGLGHRAVVPRLHVGEAGRRRGQFRCLSLVEVPPRRLGVGQLLFERSRPLGQLLLHLHLTLGRGDQFGRDALLRRAGAPPPRQRVSVQACLRAATASDNAAPSCAWRSAAAAASEARSCWEASSAAAATLKRSASRSRARVTSPSAGRELRLAVREAVREEPSSRTDAALQRCRSAASSSRSF